MRLVYSKSKSKLVIEGMDFECEARIPMLTLRDGTRRKNNIARTTPGDRPYDPVAFPNGEWEVFEVRPRKDAYREPYFVATTAKQTVRVWRTKKLENGTEVYDVPTNEYVVDEAYGMHFSLWSTTQGCIKIMSRAKLVELCEKYLIPALARKEKITLKVED